MRLRGKKRSTRHPFYVVKNETDGTGEMIQHGVMSSLGVMESDFHGQKEESDRKVMDASQLPLLVLDPSADRGRWVTHFPNRRPIMIELGIGKGKFISEMSIRHPEFNWIGVDKYDELVIRSHEQAVMMRHEIFQKNLRKTKLIDNLRFICGDVQNLRQWFMPGELHRVYLNFSDPWPKARHARRRLTHTQQLLIYADVLDEMGEIYLRTDDAGFYAYSKRTFYENGFLFLNMWTDVTGMQARDGLDEVMTEYEMKFRQQGKPIYGLHLRNRPKEKPTLNSIE